MFGKEQTLDLRVRGKNSSNENSWWQQHPDDERSHLNEECGLSVFGDILMLLA